MNSQRPGMALICIEPNLSNSTCDNTSSGRRGRLIGSLGYVLAVLGRGTGPKGEEMAAACPGVDSQDLTTILDPFRTIFVDLGLDRLSAA